jgi:hypothetical protein
VRKLLNYVANRIVRWADRRVDEHRVLLESALQEQAERAATFESSLLLQAQQIRGAVQAYNEVVGALVLTLGGEPVRLSPDLLAAASSLPPVLLEANDDGGMTVAFGQGPGEDLELDCGGFVDA